MGWPKNGGAKRGALIRIGHDFVTAAIQHPIEIVEQRFHRAFRIYIAARLGDEHGSDSAAAGNDHFAGHGALLMDQQTHRRRDPLGLHVPYQPVTDFSLRHGTNHPPRGRERTQRVALYIVLEAIDGERTGQTDDSGLGRAIQTNPSMPSKALDATFTMRPYRACCMCGQAARATRSDPNR